METRLCEPLPNVEEKLWREKSAEEYGQYLLRKNYERIKPASKYLSEGVRPRSPQTQYTLMPDELKQNNNKNPNTFFHNTTRVLTEAEKKPRHFLERYADTTNQHVIRGKTASQPYCYIRRDAFDQNLPEAYVASPDGAYPPWGPADTGFRTRSHYVAEPVERFVNIDMYRRPPTNQPGQIIMDYGRPNNGYYLQRNQYQNTWFGAKLKLNQRDVLKDIGEKSETEYNEIKHLNSNLSRSKSMNWPFVSEYEQRFAINSSQRDFE